jgi:ribosome-associated protein
MPGQGIIWRGMLAPNGASCHLGNEWATVTDIYPTDRASLERDSDIQYFIATGPGGQHRNKVETAVRLTHRPTGIVVTATERRSQHANREAAYERLAAKLEEMQKVVEPRIPTRPSAASRQRRLEEKRRSGERKRDRRASLPDE